MQALDSQVKNSLEKSVIDLEEHFTADCIFYFGPIAPPADQVFRDFLETLQVNEPERNKLTVFLNTPGGDAETVEKMVDIMRHHYAEVYFVVPDEAMSAGTILCMSGDKIFMDYSS